MKERPPLDHTGRIIKPHRLKDNPERQPGEKKKNSKATSSSPEKESRKYVISSFKRKEGKGRDNFVLKKKKSDIDIYRRGKGGESNDWAARKKGADVKLERKKKPCSVKKKKKSTPAQGIGGKDAVGGWGEKKKRDGGLAGSQRNKRSSPQERPTSPQTPTEGEKGDGHSLRKDLLQGKRGGGEVQPDKKRSSHIMCGREGRGNGVA